MHQGANCKSMEAPRSPKLLLRTVWGHGHFRACQLEAIAATLVKTDVMLVLPTGGKPQQNSLMSFVIKYSLAA
jgi:superfamily II DNA helicase RecQ